MKLEFLEFTQPPRGVSLDGKAISNFEFDSARRAVTTEIPAASDGEITITK